MSESVLNLNAELNGQLEAIRVARNLNPEKWVDAKATALNDYFRKSCLESAIVSVSGGVDSACVYKILLHAMSQDESPIKKLVAIAQPIESTESIWKRALELPTRANGQTTLNATVLEFDHTPMLNMYMSKLHETIPNSSTNTLARGNFKSAQRTLVNYFAATCYRGMVMGTGNKDEDQYLRYFTKAGDGLVDCHVIWELHKSDVFKVSRFLGVPESILSAAPSADLWEDQTDEGELGFTYDAVELVTTVLEKTAADKAAWLEGLSVESRALYEELAAKMKVVHLRNAHKAGILNFPINPNGETGLEC
jgi:NAD+ synthetase